MEPMDPSEEMSKSLIKWLQKTVPNKTQNVSEIYDGVGIVEALLQIAPEFFNKLEQKINRDVGQNWRLRALNLKKIIEEVIEYYEENLGLHLLDIGRPDVESIAKNRDLKHLGKLLRLILGCAINCNRKQEYITEMMEMAVSEQQNLMQAIQQLDQITGGSGLSLVIDNDPRVSRIQSELDICNKAKQELAERCHILEQQLQDAQSEKKSLLMENQELKAKEEQLKNTKSPDHNNRSKIEKLEEELDKMEEMRDADKTKIKEQERLIQTYLDQIDKLQEQAQNVMHLKDEMDALMENASKVKDLEHKVATYKEKLENFLEVKNMLRKTESELSEYMKKNRELEDEINRLSGLRNQCDSYREKIRELQQNLDDEINKAAKAQFKVEKLEAQFEAVKQEKERLMLERDSLREEIEELKVGQVKKDSKAVFEELSPTQLREKLRFLEKENTRLKSTNQQLDAKQVQLETALSRIQQLQEQNRIDKQTIYKLEEQIEDLKSTASNLDNQNPSPKEHIQQIASLQEALAAKDAELQGIQTKYNRSLEKAREVAQTLDMKSAALDSSLRNSQMKELEERLLTTAFYKLGLTCQREAIDERMAIITGQGQSFLARQRQPTPRNQIQRFKSK